VIEYTLLITDETLNIVGDPITNWATIDVTLRFNEPSSGLFTVPGHPWITGQLAPGNRVVVIRNLGADYDYQSSILIAGPIEHWLHERADDGENSGVGTLTVNFADDLALVAARLTYPDPAQTAAGQTTDRWQYTGNAETALRTLVNSNAGPGALAARQIPQLALGALASVGTNVTVDADRMQPLGEVMRQIADIGGGIGFRTRQSGSQILFEVFAPTDKSGSVRFGFGLGNLRYIAFEVTSPKATSAIIGGQGEGADRALIERTNSADETAWGRFETLVSRPGTSDAQSLQDDGDKALGDGAATTRVASNVADIPDQRYGVHYDLGDKVAIETWPGQQLADLVVTVHIQAWNSAGEVVTPYVGSQAAQTDPVWVSRMRDIEDRLGLLERVVKPAVPPP
jgi:hypothetical protein